MCELKEEYPECAPCYFDVLTAETGLRHDQITQYIAKSGYKVSMKQLQDLAFIF